MFVVVVKACAYERVCVCVCVCIDVAGACRRGRQIVVEMGGVIAQGMVGFGRASEYASVYVCVCARVCVCVCVCVESRGMG